MNDSTKAVNEKNVIALEQAMIKIMKDNEELRERLQRSENNITMLQQELANQKQLVGHVMGRGMGSTVHN